MVEADFLLPLELNIFRFIYNFIYIQLCIIVSMAQETASHSPNLDTVLMVERLVSKRREFASRHQLWRALPRQVQYQTFKKIIEYLEDSNKIMVDKKGSVTWIFTDNPKLEELHRASKRLR